MKNVFYTAEQTSASKLFFKENLSFQPLVLMSKINIVIRLQHWMDSVPGQTFLNYAYSWGASIVILGALFKLTHLPGGNIMLFLGMGTEVVVFFLSAFDRPFDKQEIGKELPHDYETDEEIAAKMGISLDDDDTTKAAPQPHETPVAAQPASTAAQPTIGFAQQGETAMGNHSAATNASFDSTPTKDDQPSSATTEAQTANAASTSQAAQAAINALAGQEGKPFEAEAQRLAEIIRIANDELLHRAQAVLSPEMEEATQEYIEKLRTLADTFKKVDEQSGRLARDSEEMENLNRTLTAINKTYDLHFKSISQQVGTIEQINEQTRRLAQQIEELNGVYGRMIQALTVNMRMQQPTPQQPQTQPQHPYAPNNGYYSQQPNNAGCVPPNGANFFNCNQE